MKRKDDVTFRLLQRMARIADSGHHRAAAEYCRIKGVPLRVALRVLTNPKKRRSVSNVGA